MNFTVVWVPSAEDQLADLWLNARDRGALTRAADRIHRLLGTDPINAGESRPDDRRVLIELPLVVYFEISEPDRMVRVLRVISGESLRG
jgi:hypothetical protein